VQIDRLSLSNFRGLLNSTLDFTPGFNLIVGINGAGKTSALDALKIVLAKAVPEFVDRHLTFPGVGMQKDDITLGRGAAAINCKLSRNGQSFDLEITEQRTEIRDALEANPHGVRGTRDIPLQDVGRRARRPAAGDMSLEGTLRGQTSQGTQGTLGLTPRPDPERQQSGSKPLVLHLTVRRAIVNIAKVRRPSRHPAYQDAFAEDRGFAAQPLADWWRSRNALANEAPQSRAGRQLNAVRDALRCMLPHLTEWDIEGDELTVTKMIQVIRLDADGNQITEPDRRRIPLRMLSDGERSLAAITTDIAQRLVLLNEDVDNPLTAGTGVVLIDELDLHLHPQWQRTVVEGLRSAFPNLQFICSTHSLFLIQSQRTGNLIRLDNVGDEERPAESFHQKSIEDIAEEVQGVEIPQKSKRYVDMMAAAEAYYTLLRQPAANAADLNRLKLQLDELAAPFSDDPAFQAFLKQQRMLALGTENSQ
jgi:predicted ATPase